MKKIGLVTLWKRNYGSALQCYATKVFIESMEYKCIPLYRIFTPIERYEHYLKELFRVAFYSARYRGYFKNYTTLRNAGKKSICSLSKESERKIDLFVEVDLQTRGYSYKILEKLGIDNDYVAFVAGSDQIWSGARPFDSVMFLEFVPERKRIALAPSFGSESVEKYNQKPFAKAMKKFQYLSAREKVGTNIISYLTGREVETLADPTALLSPEEWGDFCDDVKIEHENYILLHFLDAPCDVALNAIVKLKGETGLNVVAFAYPHKEYNKNKGIHFCNGGPKEYVKYIKNACYVITDSYHTTLFSIYFNTLFFTFHRQYNHTAKQTGRITNVLSLYGYEERYISDRCAFDNAIHTDMHDSSDLTKSEGTKLKTYLYKAIYAVAGETVKDTGSILKNERDCTGCGACIAVCPKEAISFKSNRFGYEVPFIDKDICINCGMCSDVCSEKIVSEYTEKKAYLAFYKDQKKRYFSASGGLFSALANWIFTKGGVAFGTVIELNGTERTVHHRKAETWEELKSLLGSKYVQSDCSNELKQVKKYLKDDRHVLFCGTSCQIKGLQRYLQKSKVDQTKLYTLDLVCHGTPGRKLFSDYVDFLENKYNTTAMDFAFRKKEVSGASPHESYSISYSISLSISDGTVINIPHNESSYYRMFLAGDSYRDACYDCEYASISKPADITLGDYFEAREDFPELFGSRDELKDVGELSCVLANTAKGRQLLCMISEDVQLYEVEVERVQVSHSNLCKPSVYGLMRGKLFAIYEKNGFDGIESYYSYRDKMLAIPKRILRK